MTDIVERLRNFCVWNSRHSHYDPVPVCKEGADEIEQLRAENAESNRLAASNFRRAKLAEAEVKRLRDAIQSLHRVWFTGPDVDKSAVAAACLSLFVVAAPQIPSAPPPSDQHTPDNRTPRKT